MTKEELVDTVHPQPFWLGGGGRGRFRMSDRHAKLHAIMPRLIVFVWYAESQIGQHIFQTSCVHVGKTDFLKVMMYCESFSLLTLFKM